MKEYDDVERNLNIKYIRMIFEGRYKQEKA